MMVWKYNITFRADSWGDYGINLEESLDPYSAIRKASGDSTVPDQPLWGILVWQVVGMFLLGLVLVCAVSCYCCERYSVRIPKVTKLTAEDEESELPVEGLKRAKHDGAIDIESEVEC